MLRMIGHVPGQSSNKPVCMGCPAVLQHVRNEGTAAMFGKKIKPQERLPDKTGENPHEQKKA